MLKNKKEKNLSSIYKLFKRVNETLDFISKKLVEYLEHHGFAFND